MEIPTIWHPATQQVRENANTSGQRVSRQLPTNHVQQVYQRSACAQCLTAVRKESWKFCVFLEVDTPKRLAAFLAKGACFFVVGGVVGGLINHYVPCD